MKIISLKKLEDNIYLNSENLIQWKNEHVEVDKKMGGNIQPFQK